MDRNSRRSKGVGYIEFYDAMSVPMAIALSGHLLFGQPGMAKPSEAEKNLVQTNASGGGSVVGSYGAVDRKLYVGNLHFNMTQFQLKQIFEAFGPVELVQLPTDPETGNCKGFGFIQMVFGVEKWIFLIYVRRTFFFFIICYYVALCFFFFFGITIIRIDNYWRGTNCFWHRTYYFCHGIDYHLTWYCGYFIFCARKK